MFDDNIYNKVSSLTAKLDLMIVKKQRDGYVSCLFEYINVLHKLQKGTKSFPSLNNILYPYFEYVAQNFSDLSISERICLSRCYFSAGLLIRNYVCQYQAGSFNERYLLAKDVCKGYQYLCETERVNPDFLSGFTDSRFKYDNFFRTKYIKNKIHFASKTIGLIDNVTKDAPGSLNYPSEQNGYRSYNDFEELKLLHFKLQKFLRDNDPANTPEMVNPKLANILHELATVNFNYAKTMPVESRTRDKLSQKAYEYMCDAYYYSPTPVQGIFKVTCAEIYAKSLINIEPHTAEQLLLDEIEYLHKIKESPNLYERTLIFSYAILGKTQLKQNKSLDAIYSFRASLHQYKRSRLHDPYFESTAQHMLIASLMSYGLKLEAQCDPNYRRSSDLPILDVIYKTYTEARQIAEENIHDPEFQRHISKIEHRRANFIATFDKDYKNAARIFHNICSTTIDIYLLQKNYRRLPDTLKRIKIDFMKAYEAGNYHDACKQFNYLHRELINLKSLDQISIPPYDPHHFKRENTDSPLANPRQIKRPRPSEPDDRKLKIIA